MSTAERPGWLARIGAMLFSGVFMLGFGGGGVFVGVLPLLDTVRQAWIVRDWVPVSAQVLDTQLEQHRGSKGSITYLLTARYGYRYQGHDFEATRVGLEPRPGADNIGDWHERWHALLTDARSREAPVAAWVNPAQPGQAVLERRVRWGLALFRVPFALLFTAVGVGAGVIFVRALLGLPGRQRRVSSASGGPGRRAAGATATRVGVLNAAELGRGAEALPRGVRGALQPPGSALRFVRHWPRVLALLMLLLLPLWLLWLLQGGPGSWTGWAARLPAALIGTAWLALALHLATLRWEWRIDAGALVIERGSWLLARRHRLMRSDLQRLSHELVYTSRTNNGPVVEHRRLQALTATGVTVKLSPALAGADNAQAVASLLQRALQLGGRVPPPRG